MSEQPPSDAEITAEIEEMTTDAPEPKEAPAAEAADEDGAEETESPEEGEEPDAPEPEDQPDEPESDDEDKDEDEEGDEDEKAEEVETKLDFATRKRLKAVERAERKAKESVAKERAELQEMLAEAREVTKKSQQVNEAIANFKANPSGALLALGYKPEDFEELARDIYYNSPKALEDPKTRAQAKTNERERLASRRYEEQQAKIDQLQGQILERQEEEQVASYLADVVSQVDDDAPLVSSMYEKAPLKTMHRLRGIAEEIFDELGEVPEPSDVVAEFERRRREELDELGIDYATAPRRTTKKNPNQAGEKKTAKTLTNNIGITTRPERTLKGDELNEQIARELDAL